MMKVFLAGATGAIGRRLLPMLVAAGHVVTGTTQHPEKVGSLRAAGATPAVMNALDASSVSEAVERAQPDAIIHELTAIPPGLDVRRFDQEFATTNRLRTEGTDNLLAAAHRSGCRRFIAQSFAAWLYEQTGDWVKTEDDRVTTKPQPGIRQTLHAIVHAEQAVLQDPSIEGFVLRYGWFYGPGTSIAPGGSVFEAIKNRRLPIVGKGSGYWSFVHIDDAASATLAALTASTTGPYNVCDDEPAPVSEWLPFLARLIGAKQPKHVPVLVARFAIGAEGVAMMTKIRGSSNQKAKNLLRWKPKLPSWRLGFRDGMQDAMPEAANRTRFATAS